MAWPCCLDPVPGRPCVLRPLRETIVEFLVKTLFDKLQKALAVPVQKLHRHGPAHIGLTIPQISVVALEVIPMGHICQSTPKYDWKLIS